MGDINLKAVEYFEAVARLGSVTMAAEEIGVSASAVSQQIRIVEKQLGVQLFRRQKRRLLLTPEGDRLFQTSSQALGALRNVAGSITRHRATHSMTARVSPSFGDRWLAPRIAEFLDEFNEWNIRIDATPTFTSFDSEAMDLDLRYGVGKWAGLVNEQVMNDLVLPVCSPGYLEKLRAAAATPCEQLQAARLIDGAMTFLRWDMWLVMNRILVPEIRYPVRFDRSSMSIELAKRGGGIALENVNFCLSELQRGELVPFAPEFDAVEYPAYWLVCPRRNLNRRIVSRFLAWIREATDRHQAEARDVLLGQGLRIRKDAAPFTFENMPHGAGD